MNIQLLDGHYNLYPLHITLDVFKDDRGAFFEAWRDAYGFDFIVPVQSNVSISNKGTLRGMHFQVSTPQSKLLTVLNGGIIDFWIDIRPSSPTFSKFAFKPVKQGEAIFIPKGFAHGFLSLEDNTIVNYLVDHCRVAANERIINAFDELILPTEENKYGVSCSIKSEIEQAIAFFEIKDIQMSEKDKSARFLNEYSEDELFNVGGDKMTWKGELTPYDVHKRYSK